MNDRKRNRDTASNVESLLYKNVYHRLSEQQICGNRTCLGQLSQREWPGLAFYAAVPAMLRATGFRLANGDRVRGASAVGDWFLGRRATRGPQKCRTEFQTQQILSCLLACHQCCCLAATDVSLLHNCMKKKEISAVERRCAWGFCGGGALWLHDGTVCACQY